MTNPLPRQTSPVALSRFETNTRDLSPHSIEAEQAVIGAILIDNSKFESVAALVTPKSFYRAIHRTIWHAMCLLDSQAKAIDYITVLEAVAALKSANRRKPEREQRELVDVELDYLAELADRVPSSANALFYANEVARRATQRDLIEVARQVVDESHDFNGPVDALLDFVSTKVSAITEATPRAVNAVKPIAAVLREMTAEWDQLEAERTTAGAAGIPTGLRDLDSRIGGLQRGKLYVIAARSGHGKSSLMSQIAAFTAAGGVPSLVFSSEMPGREICESMAGQIAEVEVARIKNGTALKSEADRITEAIKALSLLPIEIDDTPQVSVETIGKRTISALRRWQEAAKNRSSSPRHDGVVFIDYLQRLTCDALPAATHREQVVARIATQLKTLARTVNLPIVVLAQLSRGFEKERTKRLPNKSDLRESGAIEQEADALLLLWYGFKAQWADPPTRITAILDKHRGGATGKFDLRFVPEFTRFSDAEPSRDVYADVDRDPGFDSSALAPTIP